jgi:hypothetical protein
MAEIMPFVDSITRQSIVSKDIFTKRELNHVSQTVSKIENEMEISLDVYCLGDVPVEIATDVLIRNNAVFYEYHVVERRGNCKVRMCVYPDRSSAHGDADALNMLRRMGLVEETTETVGYSALKCTY